VTKIAAAEAASGSSAESGSTPERDPLTLSLAIAGFALGLAALLVSLIRRGKKA
jgi:hypothetical protein